MKTKRIILLLALFASATGAFAQKWYLTGYNQQGNIVTNGGIEAIVDIASDLDCLQSSLGNSAMYFAIMRKNGEGVWFNNVFKATFRLDGDVATNIDKVTKSAPDIAVADDYVVVSGCRRGDLVMLYAADGRVVCKRKATDARLLIDTSALRRGIYLVRTPGATLKFSNLSQHISPKRFLTMKKLLSILIALMAFATANAQYEIYTKDGSMYFWEQQQLRVNESGPASAWTLQTSKPVLLSDIKEVVRGYTVMNITLNSTPFMYDSRLQLKVGETAEYTAKSIRRRPLSRMSPGHRAIRP